METPQRTEPLLATHHTTFAALLSEGAMLCGNRKVYIMGLSLTLDQNEGVEGIQGSERRRVWVRKGISEWD